MRLVMQPSDSLQKELESERAMLIKSIQTKKFLICKFITNLLPAADFGFH